MREKKEGAPEILAGAPLLGQVTALRSGHRHNHKLLTAVFADPAAYRYVDLPDSFLTPHAVALGAAD